MGASRQRSDALSRRPRARATYLGRMSLEPVRGAAKVSLRRWLRRQVQQPAPLRERLEASIENEDPAEARRIVARFEFSALQVPARRGASLSLRASVPSATEARIDAFDASGRSLGQARRVHLVAGPNLVSWSAPLKPGLVFLRLVTDEGEVATTRAVIL